MKALGLLGSLNFLLSLSALAMDPPTGFDPDTLARVMKGEIVVKELVNTKVEFREVARAYFNKVSTEAYHQLATNHKKYPSMFSEVKDAKTLKVDDKRTMYDYWLHLVIQYGPYTIPVYPEGTQVVTPAKDPTSEAYVRNVITNYTDTLDFAVQKTRLIPYQTGILVEEDIHVKVKSEVTGGNIVKKELHKFYTRWVNTFRKELGGDH